MIEERVQKSAERFVEFWTPFLERVPNLALDYSWLSVSALDVITYSLRNVVKRGPFGDFILEGAASYLAVIAHSVWREFGAEADVVREESGVVIRALKGPKIGPEEEVVIFIEQELAIVLEELPSPMPVISKHVRPLAVTDNYLSSFGFGVLTGLSPAVEGPWVRETPESFADPLGKAVRFMARTTAEAYGRFFPEEELGQVAELYLSGLIFPLTLMDENFPLRGAVEGFMNFLEEFGVPPEKGLKLAANLAQLPDDRISGAGLAFSVAMERRGLSPKLLAVAEAYAGELGILRRAMLDVRERYGKGGDWLLKGEGAVVEGRDVSLSLEEERQIDREIELGYWPWLKMRPRKVKTFLANSDLRELLSAMALYEHKRALAAAQRIVESDPLQLEVRLQQVYLVLVNGQMDEAVALLRRLMSEPEAESEPLVYKLMASIELARNNLPEAETLIRKAMKLVGDEKVIRLELHNDYGLLNLIRGDFYGAQSEFAEALRGDPNRVLFKLNAFRAAMALSQFEPSELLREELLAGAATDKVLFAELMWPMVSAGWSGEVGGGGDS